MINGQTITTIAGTGVAGYNADGIPATAALLQNPHGVTIDASGNIYIADAYNHRIRKITIATGLISTVAGTGTPGYNADGIAATAAQLNNPHEIAFDAAGNFYIVDYLNHRIRKVNISTGIISTVAGTGTAGFNGDGILATAAELNGPPGMAFDAAGNMYIADFNNNRVRKVDVVSGFISTIAGTGTAGYNGDGIPATSAQLNAPWGVAVDGVGNIYIADAFNHRVRKISVYSNLISTVAGTGSPGYNGDGIAATTAQLYQPVKVVVDSAENVFISDQVNHRIREVNAGTGLISTVAGNGTGGYNGDGTAPTSAEIFYPWGLAMDNACNMYIGEYGGHRVRKITGGPIPTCTVPVAPGNLVSCQALPNVTIIAANNNIWVPIYDSIGRIAAKINANGNNLGLLNISLYTKTGACRVDPSHRIYLNRNITISPQFQPGTPVSIRLYLLKSELDSLRTALNDQGQPSGVSGIGDVDVFRNNDVCTPLGGNYAYPLTATTGTYYSDYYLQVSLSAFSSFSSFFFANKLLPLLLPAKIISFTGVHSGTVNMLTWKSECNSPVTFIIERSTDGIQFKAIGNVSITSTDCNQPVHFTDLTPDPAANFYRLRIIESDGTIHYSNIIPLQGQDNDELLISVDPNIVTSDQLNLQLGTKHAQQVSLIITDVQGRRVFQQAITVQAGNATIVLNTSKLGAGLYWVYAIGNAGRSNMVRVIRY